MPATFDRSLMDEIVTVSGDQAIETSRKLALEEGILAGISCGAAAYAAIEAAKKPENEGKLIVAILPDCGERYLSTVLFDHLRS